MASFTSRHLRAVHRDQFRAQRSVTSTGKLYFFMRCSLIIAAVTGARRNAETCRVDRQNRYSGSDAPRAKNSLVGGVVGGLSWLSIRTITAIDLRTWWPPGRCAVRCTFSPLHWWPSASSRPQDEAFRPPQMTFRCTMNRLIGPIESHGGYIWPHQRARIAANSHSQNFTISPLFISNPTALTDIFFDVSS